MRTLLTAITVLVAISGCAGGDPEVDQRVADDSAFPSEPSSETTTAQWASRVAEGKQDVRDAYAGWEDHSCLPTDVDALCGADLLIMSMSAETFALRIEGGMREGVPAYIGDPPDEIASLVDETLAAARTAQESGQAAVDACRAADCTTEAFQAIRDYERLISKIDAWSPYGV